LAKFAVPRPASVFVRRPHLNALLDGAVSGVDAVRAQVEVLSAQNRGLGRGAAPRGAVDQTFGRRGRLPARSRRQRASAVGLPGRGDPLEPVRRRAIDGEVLELLSHDDLLALAERLEPDTATLVVAWENRWAAAFADAVRRGGGWVLAHDRVPPDDAERALRDAGLVSGTDGVRA
jgi:hypothetical protein